MKTVSRIIILIGISTQVCFLAYAESIAFKSFLVWRKDGQGDYLLPKATGNIYESKETILAQGAITSLTVNGKYKGKAKIEVSTDGGYNYIPFIWGVPQEEGIGKGNQIKWRLTLGEGSEVEEVRISYTDTTGVIAGFGQPDLSGFKFRKPIFIKGSSKELFNYQINIKVGENKNSEFYDVHCDGSLHNDFIDIRFTAQDGQSVLLYYREFIRGENPKRTASFWVNIPQLPPEGLTIYIYYSNPESEDVSSASEVFDFFDDFSGMSINKDLWLVNDNKSEGIYIFNSELRLKTAEIISRGFEFDKGIIEYAAKTSGESPISMIISDSEGDPEDEGTYIFYSSSYKDAEHCIATGGIVRKNIRRATKPGELYNYRVIKEKERLVFERYDVNFKNREAKTILINVDDIKKGHIGFNSTVNKDRGPVYYDWIRVRKYAELQPYIARNDPKEEPTNLALFINMDIKADGGLVLKDKTKPARYVSKKIKSSFPIRVIVGYWDILNYQNNISVDISADGGETYRKKCLSTVYYYSSRLDFTSGEDLRVAVNFDGWKFKERQTKKEIKNLFDEIILDYRPGKIIVVSPNGGEKWPSGSAQDIIWSAIDYEDSYAMRIDYSIDSGSTYSPIIFYAKNSGRYKWEVPKERFNNVTIRISDSWNSDVYDVSDSSFSIISD